MLQINQQQNLEMSVVQDTLSKHPFRLVARECHPEYKGNLKTVMFTIGSGDNKVMVGGDILTIIAGPCAVHTKPQLLENAGGVKKAGAHMLRGGAFKPRTSPYDFQGLGEEGLKYLAEARELTGLPIVTEITGEKYVELVGEHADIFQIGSRNSQNYELLQDVGKYAAKHDKAILLKTGMGAKVKEILGSAEYLAKMGATKIIICERGLGLNISNNGMRGTPRPEVLKELRQATYLPVFADPSHCTGKKELVLEIAREYLEAGANGLMIETNRENEEEFIKMGGNNGDSWLEKYCDFAQGISNLDLGSFINSLNGYKVEQRWI